MTENAELQVGDAVHIKCNFTPHGTYRMTKIVSIVGDEITVQPIGYGVTIPIARDKIIPAIRNYHGTYLIWYTHTVELVSVGTEVEHAIESWMRARTTDAEYHTWCHDNMCDKYGAICDYVQNTR